MMNSDVLYWVFRQVIATWADFERRCCPFFDIVFGSERESGAAWIQLGGRTGVKAFVRAELIQPRLELFHPQRRDELAGNGIRRPSSGLRL